jgi:hypothetical protein
VGQEKGVPMITNKNQACFTKKSGCGLQEGTFSPKTPHRFRS